MEMDSHLVDFRYESRLSNAADERRRGAEGAGRRQRRNEGESGE